MSFIDFNEINLWLILPSLVLFAVAIFMLFASAFLKQIDQKFYVLFGIVGLIISLLALFSSVMQEDSFYGILSIDSLSMIAQSIILIGSLVFLPLFFNDNQKIGEFYAIFMFMIAALLFMVSSSNLIFIFVALETSSLALYTLIALSKDKATSTEAAIKYFSMGALSAGIFVFGIAMLYLGSSSLDLLVISQRLQGDYELNIAALFLGASFLIAALGFKLSLVPFHTWVKDVYRGAELNLAGFISVIPKVAISVVAIRILSMLLDTIMPELNLYTHVALCVLSIATMTIANIAALNSKDIRSMLAMSSVSHAGFIMAAILISSKSAIIAMFFYWIVLIFANMASFGLIASINKNKKEACGYDIENLNGVFSTNPAFSLALGLFLLALAGIPPLGMFWAKMALISESINSGELMLAIAMVINSAIAAAYYIRPVVCMFLKQPKEKLDIRLSSLAKIAISISGLVIVFGFLFSDLLLSQLGLLLDMLEF